MRLKWKFSDLCANVLTTTPWHISDIKFSFSVLSLSSCLCALCWPQCRTVQWKSRQTTYVSWRARSFSSCLLPSTLSSTSTCRRRYLWGFLMIWPKYSRFRCCMVLISSTWQFIILRTSLLKIQSTQKFLGCFHRSTLQNSGSVFCCWNLNSREKVSFA